MTVIDFAASYPSGNSIKAAGHRGVVLYLSPAREAWMNGKKINRAVVDGYKAAGLEIAVVWQFGKESNADVLRGRNGGLADARAADAKLKEVGLDGLPVFFAVDFDISVGTWNGTAKHYFVAAAEVLGKNRVGIYGHSRVCHWAGPEDKVIAEVAPNRYLAWQTKSWSGGEKGQDYCVLYQETHDVAGPEGVRIDINEIWFDNWGQKPVGGTPAPAPEVRPVVSPINRNPAHRGDPLFLPELLKAFGVNVVEDNGWREWGMGDFNIIWGVVAHHTGANNTSTQFIRYNPMLENGLSSQIHLSRSGVATLVGAGVAWHAGTGSYPGLPTNNANAVTIGIEAQSDGTSPWPREEYDAYIRICAAICWYLGLGADRVIGHKEWAARQGKWDPGGIDMNAFRRDIQNLINNPPFASGPTEEEQEMQFWNEMVTSLVDKGKKFARKDYISLIDYHATHANEQSKQALEEARLIREDQARLDAKLDKLIAAIQGGK